MPILDCAELPIGPVQMCGPGVAAVESRREAGSAEIVVEPEFGPLREPIMDGMRRLLASEALRSDKSRFRQFHPSGRPVLQPDATTRLPFLTSAEIDNGY